MATCTTTTDLRLELKRWEKAFADANGGRKPGRDDIKKDATISLKYREYQNSRRNTAPSGTTPKKASRASGNGLNVTPLKERSHNAIVQTPRTTEKSQDLRYHHRALGTVREEDEDEEPTPAHVRCALGPTPQKDGEVLGIFDLFPGATPSKPPTSSTMDAGVTATMTPSKKSFDPTSSLGHFSRTPQSSGKRFYLEAFAGTPLKRKREDDIGTPSAVKRQFATPAFLRRRTYSAPDDCDLHNPVPPPLPFKKRGLVRSLSSIIQGLRKQEDQRMDEESEIMREIEAEELGLSGNVPLTSVRPPPRISVVEDSQTVEMQLGPDRGVDDSDTEQLATDPGALDANGNPRKVWKKKGLKRQTKRVNMKPVLHKPQKAAETQLEDVNAHGANDCLSDEDEDDDKENREARDVESEQAELKRDKAHNEADQKKGKKLKRNALAHTNFRKLKIKNKNSKAKGRGGRFGRR